MTLTVTLIVTVGFRHSAEHSHVVAGASKSAPANTASDKVSATHVIETAQADPNQDCVLVEPQLPFVAVPLSSGLIQNMAACQAFFGFSAVPVGVPPVSRDTLTTAWSEFHAQKRLQLSR